METEVMTQDEILKELLKEFRLLREEIAGSNRPTVSTAEALKILQLKDPRVLTHFHKTGRLPSRYGGQKAGYKYLRSEVLRLQTWLLIGEVQLPKMRLKN